MKPKSPILSKSKHMDGLQCEKKLWLAKHRPELKEETSASTQRQFDEGHLVGLQAQKFFGAGDVVACDYWDYDKAVKTTSDFIAGGSKTIYEASFLYQNFFARADIFSFNVNEQAWDVIEVKKATSVHEVYLLDCAVQLWIILKSGHKVNSISLMHINNKCVYPDLSDLFTTQDITDDVMALLPFVESEIFKLLDVVQKKSEPKINIGPHCDDPYECDFKAHCWKSVPERSVFDLPGVGKKAWGYFNQGQIKITDLDEDEFTGNAKRAIQVSKKNKLWVDPKGIKATLLNFKWPLYFFDFETVLPAIPRYEGTSPYTQVPFQFSCHIWPNKPKSIKDLDQVNTKLKHFEYLHSSASDPRPDVIKAMLAGLGDSGSIVAYNQSFEISRIKELAKFDPKNSHKLLKLIDRFVDPRPIITKHTYHPDYLGSYSIKSVAPVLIGERLNYDSLDVSSGMDLQVYADLLLTGMVDDVGASGADSLDVNTRGVSAATLDADGSPVTKDQMIQSLLAYCRQDTLAMVELVKWLMVQK